jgi:hypothetical protein
MSVLLSDGGGGGVRRQFRGFGLGGFLSIFIRRPIHKMLHYITLRYWVRVVLVWAGGSVCVFELVS